MKLITTIHLAIGFILAMFCIVTLGYIKQTQKVRHNIEDVLYTDDIIRESKTTQKLILDMETGLRGYLLTGDKTFLPPYLKGRAQFSSSILLLDSLTAKDPVQNAKVQRIREKMQEWNQDFAGPLIQSRNQVHLSQRNRAYYDSLFFATAQQAKGKDKIDQTRNYFTELEANQKKIKESRLGELRESFRSTNYIAIGLTVLALIIGTITAYVLGNTIRKRFIRMTALANSIANGNYRVSLVDRHKDEISALTHSLNKMASKLQDSFSHLTKMNKELDQFAYVVSHDLKAPLRAINNLAEWIAEDMESKEPDVLQNLTMLRGRVQRMENLINGILDYSRVGRKEILQTQFSVQELLQETLENLAPPASFTFQLPDALPTITGERTLLYQVFANLFSNAIKYHHKESGTVTVHVQEKEDYYQFAVQDDGPGIPKEYHEKVFGMFQTMEARDVKESTGVGLAIVKKIVEEKGGTIWIESDRGLGTTFLFTWPKLQGTQITSSELLEENV
ncbi:ATP-binding protein [Rufibacter sp. LB8]|nr:ATP-binding protein [Rufibacter sp. LB8]